MIGNSILEKKIIWSYVKRLRIEYLIKNADLPCENKFIPLQNISINFENLAQMVGDTSLDEISTNISRSDINIGAEMFMALNSCPSFYVKLYWKAIYGSETRIAKFASNIIRKAKNGFKEKAQKIFAKISSALGFQHISYHHEGNKIDLRKNMLGIKG